MKAEALEENKDWEIESLACKIREVEMCKADKPELYSKAVKYLKKEAKAINSLDDLRDAANKDDKDEE